MNILNGSQVQLLANALEYFKAHHDKVVTQHYFDDEQTEMVQTSVEVSRQIGHLQPYFSNSSNLYLLEEETDSRILDDIFYDL
jgi:hypothetical protein